MAATLPPTSTSPDDTPFDFVIVGSGAGGAPLAARLAEQGHRVLVLEAGPDHRSGAAQSPAAEVTDVPGFHAPSTEHPDVRWRFFVKHYENPPERDPKWNNDPAGIFYPRATGVGGCTIHNALITIAGPASDWDQLAFYVGDPSWKSDVMRGYFQERVERCEYLPRRKRPRTFFARAADTFWWLIGRDDDPTVGRHGFEGWLRTSILSVQNLKKGVKDHQLLRMLKAAAKASRRAGMDRLWVFAGQLFRGEIKEALDPNHFRRQTDRPEGVALIPTAVYADNEQNQRTKDRGRRSSPARRLLEVAERLPNNLTIATDCLVTSVILEREKGGDYGATGVEYLHGPRLYRAGESKAGDGDGTPHKVHARCEVILCGGAFNTPQLLMLSGIGPADHLKAMGIECKVDAPGVGRNLQDRYEVTVVSKMKERFSLLGDATFALPTAAAPVKPGDALDEWRRHGSGLYTTNGAVVGVLKRSRPDLAQPDLFIFGIPLKFKGYAVDFSVVKQDEFDLFTWAVLKSHTQNRGGTVELASKDPRNPPLVNFHYFGSGRNTPPRRDDPDLDALVEGVKFVRRIADAAGDVVVREEHPGRDLVREDEQIRRWIMREAWGHHACGTCRMGRWTDPMAVTDSRFRVLGPFDPADPTRRRPIGGLRIVDTSIFPDIPGYFIVTNMYVASEKAADVIGLR